MKEIKILINVLKEEVERNNSKILILSKKMEDLPQGSLVMKGRYGYLYCSSKRKSLCTYLGKLDEEHEKKLREQLLERNKLKRSIRDSKNKNLIYTKMIKEGEKCLNKF